MAETFLRITDPSTNNVTEYNITRLYTGIALNYNNTMAAVKFKPNKKAEAIVFNIQQMLEDNKKVFCTTVENVPDRRMHIQISGYVYSTLMTNRVEILFYVSNYTSYRGKNK